MNRVTSKKAAERHVFFFFFILDLCAVNNADRVPTIKVMAR